MRLIKLYIMISVMVYVIGALTMMRMPFEQSSEHYTVFSVILINLFVAVMLAIIKWRKL